VSGRDGPQVTGFDRCVLIFGVALPPERYVDTAWLARFVRRKTGATAYVIQSVDRLEALGLVTTRRRGSRVWFRRTPAGLDAAGQLLRDRRISFVRAIEETENF
jgi:DNA-binding PadR family transcriptional regulator